MQFNQGVLMSAKSSRKPKPQAPVPRAKQQIEEDYGRLVAQAGQAQYQVFVYTEDVKRLNEALRNLNYEAAARNSLDKQAAEAKPKTEEAAQAQQ